MKNQSVIIRASDCLRKPLALYAHDGNKKAPRGGVLLLANEEINVSVFPTKRAAELAIHRTVKHRLKLGLEADPDHFEIQTQTSYIEEVEAILNPPRSRRKSK